MLLLRCLVALACVLLSLSGFMLQIGPRDEGFDVCPWIERFVSPCPPWLSERSIPEAAPWALYAIACLGLLFVIWPLLQATLDRPSPGPRKTCAGGSSRAKTMPPRRRSCSVAVQPAMTPFGIRTAPG